MKTFLAVFFSSAAAIFLLTNPETASNAVSGAIDACLEVIVPSLFAFSALSVFLQKSGAYRIVLKPFNSLLSKILRMDEELCGIFLLSNIGGYPVGVSLLSSLAKEERLSQNDAERLMCCCFGSGPSFIIGIVGISVFGSAAAGAVIFLSCFISSLIMALLVRAKGEIRLKSAQKTLSINPQTFVLSVNTAAKAMFSVCVMVICFSVIAAALNQAGAAALFRGFFTLFGADENSGHIFPALLEVTRIKEIVPTRFALPLCAALLSFGGTCVFLQTAALSGGLKLGKFLLSRIPAAALSAVLALILSFFLPPISAHTLSGTIETVSFSKNYVLSLCTLAMSGILLSAEIFRKE